MLVTSGSNARSIKNLSLACELIILSVILVTFILDQRQTRDTMRLINSILPAFLGAALASTDNSAGDLTGISYFSLHLVI